MQTDVKLFHHMKCFPETFNTKTTTVQWKNGFEFLSMTYSAFNFVYETN